MSEKNKRIAVCTRKTKETDITLSVNLDGQGKNKIDTGIAFFDHMLDGFARHGLFDLEVKVDGDLEVDSHHTIEDVGIVLGTAIKKALGDKAGIKRYGYLFFRWMKCLLFVQQIFRDVLILSLTPDLQQTN